MASTPCHRANNPQAREQAAAAPRAAQSNMLPRMSSSLRAVSHSRGVLAQLPGLGLQPVATGQRQFTRALTTPQASPEDRSSGPSTGAPKVVILGGGFGGLYSAVRLSSLFWPSGKKPQVTLVDRADRFVFKPLLYELLNGAASEAEVAPSYSQLLAPYPVRFIQSKVVSAQPVQLLKDGGSATGGSVQLENGVSLDYDWLIIALGSQADSRGVKGVSELAVPFNTYDDAIKVRDALSSIESAAEGEGFSSEARQVMVVGAGYAGVELAAVIAERLRGKGLQNSIQVSIVTPGQGILEGSPAGQRQAAQEVLDKLGVSVVTGTRVRSLEAAQTQGALPTTAHVNLDDRAFGMSDVRDAAAGVADAAAAAASTFASAASAAADALRQPGAAEAAAAGGEAFTAAGATAGDAHSSNGSAAASSQGGARKVVADLVLWTAGNSPTTKSERKGFPFPTNERGSVTTDATLRVMSHSRVFALGDVAVADQGYMQDAAATSTYGGQHTSSTSFPATAQVALQQADYAAWNVWASIAGRPLLPFRYQHLGSMMSLGAFNAAVELPVPIPDQLQTAVQATPIAPLLEAVGIKLSPASAPGAGGGMTVEGPLAALLRRAAYLYRQPTGEQRLSVATEWVSQAASFAAGMVGAGAKGSSAP